MLQIKSSRETSNLWQLVKIQSLTTTRSGYSRIMKLQTGELQSSHLQAFHENELPKTDFGTLKSVTVKAAKARDETIRTLAPRIEQQIHEAESQIQEAIQSSPSVPLPEPRESRPEPQGGLNLLELNQLLQTVQPPQ